MTAQTLEIVWTLAFAVALIFSLLGLREAERDLIVLDALKVDGPKHIAVRGVIRREALRLAENTLFLGVGILALQAHDFATIVRIIVRVGLVVAAMLHAAQSLVDTYSRRALARALDQ